MKYLVSELVGALLDAAVAKADGLEPRIEPYRVTGGYGITFVRDDPVCVVGAEHFSPSSDWSHGGPIIERERIALQFYSQHWGAVPHNAAGHEVPDLDERKHTQMGNGWCPVMADGETALVAAMRAFVRMRLGDEVEL